MSGIGGLGLQSGLRTYMDWERESARDPQAIVLVSPGTVVTGWSVYSGNCYVANVPLEWAGALLAVTSLRCGIAPYSLPRQQALADAVATAGSWYFDSSVIYSSGLRKWDDALGPWWDQPDARWDAGSVRLYVHLPGDADPATTTIVAEYLIALGSKGLVIPEFGKDLILDGGFERWTAGSLDHWSIAKVGGVHVTVSAETISVTRGETALKIAFDGAQADPSCIASQTVLARAGLRQWYWAAYRTSEDASASLQPYVRVGAAGAYLQADGWSTAASGWLALPQTYGEWRRLLFRVRPPADATWTFDLRAWNGDDASSPSGSVWFDSAGARPVHRYCYAEPRLSADALPEISQSRRDVEFGGLSVGSGTVEVVGADGALDDLLHDLDWSGRPLAIYSGGAFGNGEELGFEEWEAAASMLLSKEGPAWDDLRVSLPVVDAHERFNVPLPTRSYSKADFPNLADSAEGRSRAILLGPKTGITPVRIDETAVHYGIYEIADCQDSPAGLHGISAVYAYADEDAANAKDSARRVTLTTVTDYTKDLPNGRITLVSDVQIITITADKNRLYFDEGGAELVAVLTPGVYIPRTLAAHGTTAIATAGGSSTLAYEESGAHAYEFKWSKASGTLNLRRSASASRTAEAWEAIGVASGDDLTGQLTYYSDAPLFADGDADTKHLVRADADGYADDALGTYTGTASAMIQTLAPMVRYLCSAVLQWPDLIDDAAFDAATANSTEILGLYLGEQLNFRELLDRFEITAGAYIAIGEDGLLRCELVTATVPDNVVALADVDFLSFQMSRPCVDVCRLIQLDYDRDPSTGTPRSRTFESAAEVIRLGQTDTRTFETLHTDVNDAVTRGNAIRSASVARPRIIECEVPGYLLRSRIGRKYRITRTRALGGALDQVLFRVLGLRKRPLGARASVRLVEVL